MRERNVVQTTFDEFGKAAGMRKQSASWLQRSDETVFVLNLQRSNYSVRYYVNVAVWLLALGENDAPKENNCHVRTRLDDLVGHSQEARLTELLDMGAQIDDHVRRLELLSVFEVHVRPMMHAAQTLNGLRSEVGQALITRSLVTGAAEQLLASR